MIIHRNHGNKNRYCIIYTDCKILFLIRISQVHTTQWQYFVRLVFKNYEMFFLSKPVKNDSMKSAMCSRKFEIAILKEKKACEWGCDRKIPVWCKLHLKVFSKVRFACVVTKSRSKRIFCFFGVLKCSFFS